MSFPFVAFVNVSPVNDVLMYDGETGGNVAANMLSAVMYFVAPI